MTKNRIIKILLQYLTPTKQLDKQRTDNRTDKRTDSQTDN